MNWLIAAILFFSGANLVGLVVPVGFALTPLALLMFTRRPARLSAGQLAILSIAILVAVVGIARATEFAEAADNLRQLFVIFVAALLAGMLGDACDEVIQKYFAIFSAAALVGVAFYLLAPNFSPLSTAIGTRAYLIGPSSSLFDRGYRPQSFLGPYRFQGLFDEPGSFAALGAGAAFYAMLVRKRLRAGFIVAAMTLSEGLAGFGSMIVLMTADVLGKVSLARKIILASVLGLLLAAFYFSAIGQTLIAALEGFIELRRQSGEVRGNQLDLVVEQWQDLILPGGFSNSAVIRIAPDSVTIGFVRTLIFFGIPFTAALMVALLVAFRRTPFRTAMGVMLSTLILSGFSRFGVFDLLLGWFVLFAAMRRQGRNTAAPTPRSSQVHHDIGQSPFLR